MNKQEKIAISIQSLYNFAYVMYNMFVSVFLFIYTNSLVTIMLYNFLRAGLIVIFIYFGSRLTSKHSYALSYCLGLLLQALSLIYILLFSELFTSNISLIYIAAILMGIGEGLYYFSTNLLDLVVTTNDRRANYLVTIGILKNIASILAPIVADILLTYIPSENKAYHYILAVVAFVFIVITIISTRLNVKVKQESVKVKDVFKIKDSKLFISVESCVIYSLREFLNWGYINIIISNITNGGDTYSKTQIFYTVLTILCFIVLRKLLSMQNIKYTLALGCLVNAASLFIIVFVQNIYGLIIYGVLNAISSSFYDNSRNLIDLNIINNHKEQFNNILIFKEFCYFVGRLICTVLVLTCFYFLPSSISYKFPVILSALSPIAIYLIYRKTIID